jgi:hypothetical protein
MPRPGSNQILLNMANGSKAMQLRLFLKYRHLMNGILQPERDVFAAACMADLLRKKSPDLALVHLTCFDTMCHEYGEDFDALERAFKVLDDSLGLLLEAAGPDAGVIVFSDHAQIPVHDSLFPNDLLVEAGLLFKKDGLYQKGGSGCFIECCGGSAFFHPGLMPSSQIEAVRETVQASRGFNRFLTTAEMAACGRPELPFGFCAAAGYDYAPCPHHEKAQHGYPLDYPDYKVFYAVRGPQVHAGVTLEGGSLLDIAPIALRLLGNGLPPAQKPAIPGLPPARGGVFSCDTGS